MSTAVIITGHMRTFATCIHTLRWHVLRHYSANGLEFYVSTVQDEDAASAELLRSMFPGCPVHIEVVAKQPDLFEPPEAVRFEPYERSVPLQAVLRQLWQMEQGWILYKAKAKQRAGLFIRVRPDLYFHNFVPPVVWGGLVSTPWWGKFGGVNDRLAVIGPDAAEAYFTAYSHIPDAQAEGCPLHPESLVRAACEMRGAITDTRLIAEFTTLRKDGQHRPPEITPWDLAHAGLTI